MSCSFYEFGFAKALCFEGHTVLVWRITIIVFGWHIPLVPICLFLSKVKDVPVWCPIFIVHSREKHKGGSESDLNFGKLVWPTISGKSANKRKHNKTNSMLHTVDISELSAKGSLSLSMRSVADEHLGTRGFLYIVQCTTRAREWSAEVIWQIQMA